ncbi:MAG: thiamine pyrophosphate-dependent enzyme, partial [Alphaproteobacteria bacterium]|nr:thiamine pyrophosphate-dependent enzyme [Alphaproteobacteria bacterium]
FYKRGEAFGIPSEQVDGMSVLAVREAGERAVKHVREGNGPMLLEIKTYRYRGHSMSDPAKYRTREEVEQFRETRDPIDGIKKIILDSGYFKEEDIKKVDNEIKEIVNASAEYSKESPEPDAFELYTDVLAEY